MKLTKICAFVMLIRGKTQLSKCRYVLKIRTSLKAGHKMFVNIQE